MSESLLKLPKGKQSYENIVKNNFYYVDKTRALKTVFEEESSQVLLITRPRRFGKSLTLSMFNYFLAGAVFAAGAFLVVTCLVTGAFFTGAAFLASTLAGALASALAVLPFNTF